MLEKIHAPGKDEVHIGIELFRSIILLRDCQRLHRSFACMSDQLTLSCIIIVPAGHVYSSGGVCVGAQGGRGCKKWGSLLVAGIQNEGVITYSAL